MGRIIPALTNQWTMFVNDASTPAPGVCSDLKLPELEAMTETLNDAGIAGEIEIPATGHFKNGLVELKYNMLDKEYFKMLDTTDVPKVTFQICKQYVDSETSAMLYKAIRIIVRGPAIGAALGTLAAAKKMESEVKLAYTLLDITEEGQNLLTIDKYNMKYTINNKDRMKEIKRCLML